MLIEKEHIFITSLNNFFFLYTVLLKILLCRPVVLRIDETSNITFFLFLKNEEKKIVFTYNAAIRNVLKQLISPSNCLLQLSFINL